MRYLTIFSTVLLFLAFCSFNKIQKLTVTSTAFANNMMIPIKYTCRGQGTNPPLKIENIPPGAKSLAIVVEDADACTDVTVQKPVVKKNTFQKKKSTYRKVMQDTTISIQGFAHWIVWNIDVSNVIPENFVDDHMGKNSAGLMNYAPLCPQSGTHHYHFIIYALDTKLDIPKGSSKARLEKVMAGHILAKGELTGWVNKDYR